MKFLSVSLGALLLTTTTLTNAAQPERYIVKFQQGKGAQVKALVQQARGEIALELAKHNALAAQLPSQALAGLTQNPMIEYVEKDVKRYLLAESQPYGIGAVQADRVSDASASNQSVCIIDSGYDIRHPDLANNNVSGSFDSGTGNWFEDENGHGTHVAGTIAGLTNGEGVVGVLPSGTVNLHIVKVFDADGWAYSSSLIAALDECEAAGANVVNMSLGGSFKSRAEQTAFAQAYDRGVLSIAAAGNDGNTRHSYPASYESVISVAAVDENNLVASFSQQTSQVELAGPGVGVLSSVPLGFGRQTDLSVANQAISAEAMDGSPLGSASGALIDCGLGESSCLGAAGAVCLIQRGNIAFSDKVLACEAGGGVAAIIYNNEPGMLLGTLGGIATSIPSVGISQADGEALVAGQSASVNLAASDYAIYDGTSMATPHVVGVAALVWSHFPSCSAAEIRQALTASALDLGVAGRDAAYGYGLVQALDSVNYLTTHPCGSSTGGGGDTGPGDKPCRGKNCP